MNAFLMLSLLALSPTAFSQESIQPAPAVITTKIAPMSQEASEIIGSILRQAEQQGNSAIQLGDGLQISTYSINNEELVCYFMKSDNSVACAADDATISEKGSEILGQLLSEAQQNGVSAVQVQGGPQVTSYSIRNEELSCHFQKSNDSVSCALSNNIPPFAL